MWVGPFVDYEGKVTTDWVEAANALNDYFASVFTDEVTDNLPETVKILTKTMEKSLQNVEFTTEVVLKKLSQPKQYKAPGVDNLSSTMLREVAAAIASELSKYFIVSMAKGKVPVDWKSANVTSIYKKKGIKSQPSNFRPVSLKSQVSKVMKAIIRDEIVGHLQNHVMTKRFIT